MKRKIGIVCLLLIFVYCLSAVCATDLNQTTDDIKTNDEKDSNMVFENDNNVVDNVSCEDIAAEDVAEVEVDNNNNTNCSEVNCMPHNDSKINNELDIKDVMPIGMDIKDIIKVLRNHTQHKVSFAMGSKLAHAKNSDLISQSVKTPKYTTVKNTSPTTVKNFSILQIISILFPSPIHVKGIN